MRIPVQKEIAMKRAIFNAIKNGQSAAKLADGFGVSKSTIYKYRRALRDQGFVKKNENDVYVVTQSKFLEDISSKPSKNITKENTSIGNPEKQTPSIDTPDMATTNTQTHNTEEKIQEKLREIRMTRVAAQQAEENTGLFKKFFNKFKKS
ncbi:hypothetical protein LO80_07965 [Candidatus Francisella endociliophora]|uniref:Resolvase HTH domain-containing protein n=1 Tax=Candidatus Francisella endociliophora TaxID=653937 RepID=A0A097EQR4_9GAMM|nr:helix-turn-helix domain-containing protein [Francisella sp. FSC1006]AIT09908.1 hypothetical protein LO80_07965 [Francisella sp. FSC1006]